MNGKKVTIRFPEDLMEPINQVVEENEDIEKSYAVRYCIDRMLPSVSGYDSMERNERLENELASYNIDLEEDDYVTVLVRDEEFEQDTFEAMSQVVERLEQGEPEEAERAAQDFLDKYSEE